MAGPGIEPGTFGSSVKRATDNATWPSKYDLHYDDALGDVLLPQYLITLSAVEINKF